jgi:hypothetical protein
MTGVLNAVVAQSALGYAVNVSAPGGGLFGWNGLSGSVTPSTLKGATINDLYSIGTSSLNLRLDLSSVVAQSYFRYLVVQDSTGALQTFTSASATFSNPGGTSTRWDWSGSGVWTTSHASRLLTFYF